MLFITSVLNWWRICEQAELLRQQRKRRQSRIHNTVPTDHTRFGTCLNRSVGNAYFCVASQHPNQRANLRATTTNTNLRGSWSGQPTGQSLNAGAAPFIVSQYYEHNSLQCRRLIYLRHLVYALVIHTKPRLYGQDTRYSSRTPSSVDDIPRG